MIGKTCALLAFVAITVSATVPGMTEYTVSAKNVARFGAAQLNGDAPIFNARFNASSTGWVLFLEGGGWCYGLTPADTITSCAHRAGYHPTTDGGDAPVSTDVPDYGGILSSNSTLNPDFFHWNAVFIRYRDGSSFSSGRTDPIPIKTADGTKMMYMRGRANFDAVITDLLELYGMNKATEVILSGGSAGGLATYINLDHLAALLPSGSRLVGFPDAGYFLDQPDAYTGEYVYRNSFIGADPVWNSTASGGTNAACLAALPTTDHWKCLMAPYLIQYIKTPVFVMNSEYDAWQLPNIASLKCIPTPTKPCAGNASTVIAEYGAAFRDAIQAVEKANPANGAFVDSCYVHEQNVAYCSNQGIPNCVGWTPESVGSVKWGYKTAVTWCGGASDGGSTDCPRVTPQAAFSAWYFGRHKSGSSVMIVDDEAFNANPTCVFTDSPVA